MRTTAIGIYSMTVFDRIAAQSVGSRYREAFRMTVPISVQRALRISCGDRIVKSGDFKGIVDPLDYPCAAGLDEAALAGAAAALRSNADIIPVLRLRVADLETQIIDLTQNNKDVVAGLAAVTGERP